MSGNSPSDRDQRSAAFRRIKAHHRAAKSPCVRCAESNFIREHVSIDHFDRAAGNVESNLHPLCEKHTRFKDDLDQDKRVPFTKRGKPTKASLRVQRHLEIGYLPNCSV